MSKRLALCAGVAVCVFLAAAVLAPGRAFAPVPPGTFHFTGSEQSWPVPANVTGVNVVIVGAQGAPCCGATVTEAGGDSSELTADVPLPAETSILYVEVGGVGATGNDATDGGWNGGGGGPFGGGGASDIRTVSCGSGCATGGDVASLSSRLAAAGGGGGASDDQPGGAGGNQPACQLCGGAGDAVRGGMAATKDSVTGYCQEAGDMDGESALDGSLGSGSAAATFLLTGTPEDGGGGGGWYGGAGGAQCYDSGALATTNAGAGGGGSSNTVQAAQNVSVFYLDSTDRAEVVITAPVPSAITTSLPTLAGGLTLGDTLSESHGQWSSTAMPVTGYAYQWERCDGSGAGCTPISGATGQAYTLLAADLGHTIRVQETAENFYGSSATPSTSAASGAVGEAPTSTSPPQVMGKAVQGDALLESHGSWTDGPVTGYAYQWERCSGGSCAAIPGAVSSTYTPTKPDVGSTIKIEETATNAYGTSAAATSAPTSKVLPAAPARFTLLGRPTATATAVTVSLRCPAMGARCRGSARLTTLERLLKGKIVRLLAGTTSHGKVTLVGSKTFSLAGGAKRKLVVPLNKRGRRLLARFRKIPATLTITLLNTTPRTRITARATIKRKHHR